MGWTRIAPIWKVKVVLFVLVVWFLWGVFQDFGVALLVGALLFIFFSHR